MIIFVSQKIAEVSGRINVFKLIINQKISYDEFERKICKESTYRKELLTIQARLAEMAEGKLLPEKKFRNITRIGDPVKEYELKTRNLRVYLFHEENTGRIIVTGGKKSEQQKTIKYFRNIKLQYLYQKSHYYDIKE